MDFINAIILGVVEGITEFLPISSTGHLILTSNFLRIPQTEFLKTFEIIIQTGAILSVIVLYSRRIIGNFSLMKKVIIAFIPTAIIGLTLYKMIKSMLGNPMLVVTTLFFGGIILIIIELWFKSRQKGTKKESLETNDYSIISYQKAVVIGLFQSISMVPGVSRAAATIIGGMLVGLPRKTAVEFSFMLAIPTMFAATLLDLKESSFSFTNSEWLALSIGFITSFLVALVVIKWLVKYVQTNNFIVFGVYRIVISILYFFFIL